MFQDADQNFFGEVQTVKLRVPLFVLCHNFKTAQVVVKSTDLRLFHYLIQNVFTGVAEWWMSQVMSQGNRLDQIFVELQAASDSAGDLGHFNGVRETRAVII